MDKLLCMVALGAIATVLFHSAEAQTTHVVGDTDGWRVPTDASRYTTWAAGKNFRVGDTLVFTFTAGRHDVQEVEKSSFDGCSNSTNVISPPIMTSPANVTILSAGEHYYICTFPEHCSGGQKLAINVSGPDGAIPPATVGSTTPSATPPVAGGNSGSATTPGSSIAVFASLMVTSLSIALTIFY